MNYREWGQEYLQEAQMLKKRILPLKSELKNVSGEAAALLYRRIAMLNEMYLECSHTGTYLIELEDENAEKNIAQL